MAFWNSHQHVLSGAEKYFTFDTLTLCHQSRSQIKIDVWALHLKPVVRSQNYIVSSLVAMFTCYRCCYFPVGWPGALPSWEKMIQRHCKMSYSEILNSQMKIHQRDIQIFLIMPRSSSQAYFSLIQGTVQQILTPSFLLLVLLLP